MADWIIMECFTQHNMRRHIQLPGSCSTMWTL